MTLLWIDSRKLNVEEGTSPSVKEILQVCPELRNIRGKEINGWKIKKLLVLPKVDLLVPEY